jgi:SPP1 gp7 family putative phage head morphogenesis protein
MNLNPISKLRAISRRVWPTGEKFNNPGGELAAIVHVGNPMGPWTDAMGGFEPRKVSPALYEALREALPILDGSIARLVELDGIIRVRGDNDAIVAEIEDWMRDVPVNDAEKGLQAVYEAQGNERYEQGFGIVEWVTDKKSTDIVGMRVADSKGIHFRRDATGLQVFYRPPGRNLEVGAGDARGNVERILRGQAAQTIDAGQLLAWGYKPLDRARLLYTVNQPDADNPYGNSVLRSLEFNGQSLLVIQNALQRSWARFGDPPLLVVYKVANKRVVDNPVELDKRRDQIAKNLRTAMEEKGKGNSVDVVQAIGKDDDLVIKVIGGEGEVLEIEAPARHLLEQVVSKVGLPPWMLGLQFSTSERMAEQQAGMALQGSKTRFERRRPDLTHLVATMLRLRGRTWKRGDWELYQELPNIQDKLKDAQAGFLLAQTAMMSRGGDARSATDSPRGVDNNLRSSRGRGHKHPRKAGDADDDEDPDGYGEAWAEDDPALPRIEEEANKTIGRAWRVLALAVLAALSLRTGEGEGDGGEGGWRFDIGVLPALLAAGETFRAAAGGALAVGTAGAFGRGLANAAAQIPQAAPLDLTEAIVASLRANALDMVGDTFDRTYIEGIVNILVAGVYNGLSADVIARQLRKKFTAADYDWKRLVASELAAAHGDAKLQQMLSNGIEGYDWSTAGDGEVCAICTGHRDNGPYVVGSGPRPVKDSHPLCRCSVIPYLPDEP